MSSKKGGIGAVYACESVIKCYDDFCNIVLRNFKPQYTFLVDKNNIIVDILGDFKKNIWSALGVCVDLFVFMQRNDSGLNKYVEFQLHLF